MGRERGRVRENKIKSESDQRLIEEKRRGGGWKKREEQRGNGRKREGEKVGLKMAGRKWTERAGGGRE